ncbi:TlpA disulfide reductase family protein [Kangiella marina]
MLSVSLGPLSLPVDRLLLLISFAAAMLVAYLVGRRNQSPADGKIATIFIGSMLVARLVFVAQYWEQYQVSWWSVIDIRDAGFNPWAGVGTAVLMTLYMLSQHKKIRKALVSGLSAGAGLWLLVMASLWMIRDTSQQLPTIVVQELSGNSVEIGEIEAGKPRVINLWATWCPPCRREMPVLQAAQQNTDEIGFIFANQGEHQAVIKQYLDTESLALRNVTADSKALLGQMVGSRALPTTLFIDGQGRIVDAHLGELSHAKLASKLERLKTLNKEQSKVNN